MAVTPHSTSMQETLPWVLPSDVALTFPTTAGPGQARGRAWFYWAETGVDFFIAIEINTKNPFQRSCWKDPPLHQMEVICTSEPLSYGLPLCSKLLKAGVE